MVGYHHQLRGHEPEQTPGDSEGQGRLACCSPQSRRVRHDLVTEQQQQQKWRINPDINKPSLPQDSNTLVADQSQNLSIYFLIPIPFPAMHVCYPVSLHEGESCSVLSDSL